ncbi:hypothetical protein Hanom_Chr04g00379761 [Helianthus anomalus]
MNCDNKFVYGLVSTISYGSIPAIGFPTGFLTLSIPLCRLVNPTSSRPLKIAGASGSVTPRICQFWRVVTSAQPRSPYCFITLAKYLVCALVVTPFGSFNRIINRPSTHQKPLINRISGLFLVFEQKVMIFMYMMTQND